MGTFAYRAMGAAVLDRSTYEWVEADRPATRQAFTLVLLSSLAAGIGAGGWEGPRLVTLVGVAVLALGSWLAWARLILYLGGTVFPERDTQVDFGQLLRTIGFAATPGIIQAFAVIPPMTTPVFVVAWVWMLAAMVVAVRQALDFQSTWRALGVCLVALTVVLLTAIAVALAFERVVG